MTAAIDARTAFERERLSGIGGSDAAAACGASPYRTPYQLWLEKTGRVPAIDLSNVEAVRWGVKLEAVVAAEYAERTGRTVHRVTTQLRHREHEFMVAHIDRRVVGERRGLEVKTAGTWAARSEEWGPSGSDQVPQHYLLQCAHYLAVTGYTLWDLAVLIGGQDFRIYTIPRDEDLIAELVRLEAEFWRCVREDRPPQIATIADAQTRWPRSDESAAEATLELVAAAGDVEILAREIAEREARIEQHKLAAMAQMGESGALVFDGQEIATWKTREATTLDTKRLKAERPDVYAEYARTSSSRTFKWAKAR